MIFFGSGIFGQVILDGILKRGMAPTLVVTHAHNDLVALRAREAGIQAVTPQHLEELRPHLSPAPNHFLVASYGKILPKWLLEIPTHGALNLHPSLLPKYRGSSPLQATILNGDTETGVTFMVMDEKMDHGGVIANSKFEIRNSNMARPELEKELAMLGAEVYCKNVDAWLRGETQAAPQDESMATYTKIVHRDDGRIDWSKSAQEIDRMRRAYEPWPGIWTKWRGKRLKILIATSSMGAPDMPFGTVLTSGAHGVAIVCGEKSMYQLLEVQLEGKKPMDIVSFVRGQQSFIGSTFA